MKIYDVIIIGGGLAGLTAAIHLAKHKKEILLIEKDSFPRHKVCGEYVSNEVLPYLNTLDLNLKNLQPKSIDQLLLSNRNGESVNSKLPLGGFGVSRFALDNFLYEKAQSLGVKFVFESVFDVSFKNDSFEVSTRAENYNSKLVLGAFGKRSNLDKTFQREFIQKKSPWIGIKAHYKNKDFPEDLVALHNFEGGYCGLSKTETDAVNFCYLAKYSSFKTEKNVNDFNQNVLRKNPFLDEFLNDSKLLFEKHLAISQISFHKKNPVENHILMLGDAAGLIHPLCGNGMAMAIHSAKMASEEILAYFQHHQRSDLEQNYSRIWQKQFNGRLRMGRYFQKILLHPKLTNFGINMVSKSPFLLQKMIQQTHGKPIS
ncbi:NAD(P)/FAD-dependent oxidoreductase [Psychroflexus aestuariivivens]|uniref:NAD(P)/FAD-dependent oxidoreductase n=1 Tax=Psychroflexus aestuariivivens TaxID=1795040 RepID=UPI000FD90553|nr:NAD(P)/FAD-dependent oxidoreductase [Psychroflexus aestuariivivens]